MAGKGVGQPRVRYAAHSLALLYHCRSPSWISVACRRSNEMQMTPVTQIFACSPRLGPRSSGLAGCAAWTLRAQAAV